MKRVAEIMKTIRQFRQANAENINQYCDHVTILAVLGIIPPVYTILKTHTTKSINSKYDNKSRYVLVGNKTCLDQVERHIRIKLGEPLKPLFLLKWYFTAIEKIEKPKQLEKLKSEEKPITFYLCTSAKTDHSKETFFLPRSTNDLPPTTQKRGIIVVKATEDDLKAVTKSVDSLCKIEGVKQIFGKTKVLQLTTDTSKENDIQAEIALLTIAIYVLAAFSYFLRRRYGSKIKKS